MGISKVVHVLCLTASSSAYRDDIIAPMKLLHTSAIVSAIVVVAAIAGVWYFFDHLPESGMQTMIVHPAAYSETVAVSGQVVAARDVDLGFAQGGRVSRIYADVGQRVKQGDLIAETENGDVRALLSQAKAALAAQQAQLASLKAGTRPEAIAVTQAQLSSDQAALSQTNAALVNVIQSAYTVSDDAVRNKTDQFITNPRSPAPLVAFTTSNSQSAMNLSIDRVSAESLLVAWQSQVAALSPDGDLSSAQQTAEKNLAQIASLLADANTALVSAVPGTVSQNQINTFIKTFQLIIHEDMVIVPDIQRCCVRFQGTCH